MKSGSNASAWMRKAESACPAGRPWPNATRKWAAGLQRASKAKAAVKSVVIAAESVVIVKTGATEVAIEGTVGIVVAVIGETEAAVATIEVAAAEENVVPEIAGAEIVLLVAQIGPPAVVANVVAAAIGQSAAATGAEIVVETAAEKFRE